MAALAEVFEVAVPDIGDFADVLVVEVLVGVGDRVEPEAGLVVLETDKATMDVPSPVAGVVAEMLVAVDDRVSQGSPLVRLEVGDRLEVPAADETPAMEAAQPAAAPQITAANGVRTSPAVRAVARELGVDLQSVRSSGHEGRVLADDVRRAVEPGRSDTHERVPLTRIQQLSAARLSTAWQTIPHVTHHDDADITELEEFRAQLNLEQSRVKVTVVSLLLKACAAALDTFPRFASTLDGDELLVKRQRNLGFATDTPGGLLVPVIRDVREKGLLQVAGELTELSGKARAGKLSPNEMSGAVFTISSLGGIGGTGFTPIINPPQVAILGVARSAHQAVWDGEDFVPRLRLPLSLSYDHRVIDGAEAACFCVHLGTLLGDLRRVLL
jgi:pyruvate dehydrogenase E2 component (dihydrolipoamide acetyltransferase)